MVFGTSTWGPCDLGSILELDFSLNQFVVEYYVLIRLLHIGPPTNFSSLLTLPFWSRPAIKGKRVGEWRLQNGGVSILLESWEVIRSPVGLHWSLWPTIEIRQVLPSAWLRRPRGKDTSIQESNGKPHRISDCHRRTTALLLRRLLRWHSIL